jgi:hypothetical protein
MDVIKLNLYVKSFETQVCTFDGNNGAVVMATALDSGDRGVESAQNVNEISGLSLMLKRKTHYFVRI